MENNEKKPTKKQKSQARVSGEIATYVLLFLAAFTVLLVVLSG